MIDFDTAGLTTSNTLSEILHNVSSGHAWVGDYHLSLSRRGDIESLTITDGRDAFKPKSNCPVYRIEGQNYYNCPVMNSDWMDFDLDTVVELLEAVEFPERVCTYGKHSYVIYDHVEIDGLTIYRTDSEAKNCFNPNALDRLKPVKSLPEVGKTVRLPTVVKLLVNDQVSAFRDQKLTDDYAWDAATDFGKGAVGNCWLAEELVESPSGWRAYMREDGKLTVACHSFEYHTLTVTDPKLL